MLNNINHNNSNKKRNNEYLSSIMALSDKKNLLQKRNSDLINNSKIISKINNEENSISNDLNYSEDENYLNNFNENKKIKNKNECLSRQHSQSKFELTILSKKSINEEEENSKNNVFKRLKEKTNKIMLDEGTQYYEDLDYNIQYNSLNPDYDTLNRNKIIDLKRIHRKSIVDSNISDNKTAYSKKIDSSRSTYLNRNSSKKSFLSFYDKGLSHNPSYINFLDKNLNNFNSIKDEDDTFYHIQPKSKVFDKKNNNNNLYNKIPHHDRNEFWNLDKRNKSSKNSFIFVNNNNSLNENDNNNNNILLDYQIKENIEKYKKKNIKLTKKNKENNGSFIMPANPYKTVLEAREFFFFNEK